MGPLLHGWFTDRRVPDRDTQAFLALERIRPESDSGCTKVRVKVPGVNAGNWPADAGARSMRWLSKGTPVHRLVLHPDPVLRAKAESVDAVDEDIVALCRDMIRIMHESEGIGLAAPQVGRSLRIFVTNSGQEGEPDRVYINPVLSDFAGELVSREEGCLSLPGIHGDIRRLSEVTVTAMDMDGREFAMTDGGLLARVWQHENDHLDGVLILDRMNMKDRLSNRKAVRMLVESAGT